VLGVALDGIGLGDDGTLWGAEFLVADYRRFTRVGTLRPVRLLGGDAASREPWRNLYAQLVTRLGWPLLHARFGTLEVVRWLADRPRKTLDAMLEHGAGSPLASSCGRLFDAMAAAVGIGRDRVSYEGEAAIELEAAVDEAALDAGYPFAITTGSLPGMDPRPLWDAVLDDLARSTPIGIMAARFHRGLADAIAAMVRRVAGDLDTVALTGGVFQNAILLELVTAALRTAGFRVLTHARLPTGDGGVSLGQAVIAAATHPSEQKAS
jgi:hydrogenase maturation protein HypF